MNNNNAGFFYKNSLSIVMLALMLFFLIGQFYTGWKEFNNEHVEQGMPAISAGDYFFTGHFMQATFENWESEFLQMAMYVMLTVSLRQKGSAESKKLFGKEEVDRDPKPGPKSPWPVNKGGLWLKLYSNSLSIILFLLFLISFLFHLLGSWEDYNYQQLCEQREQSSLFSYLTNTKFWFESFQNWQSEFLSVAAIVLLSIWFRQKGSPESKPVDAADEETGK